MPTPPSNDKERLHALHALCVLDTAPDERFDRLTRLAQKLFSAPIVLVTLVDGERQWFKSRKGIALSETPRSLSFCAHTILTPDGLVINDIALDARFHDHPWVRGAPHVRFYAGMPLHTADGFRVGALCILDTKPRQLSSTETAALRDLARCVEHELQSTARLTASDTLRQAMLDAADQMVVVTDPAGKIRAFNRCAERLLGQVSGLMLGLPIWQMLCRPEEKGEHVSASPELSGGWDTLTERIKPGQTRLAEWRFRCRDGHTMPVMLSLTALTDSLGRLAGYLLMASDLGERKKADVIKSEFIATVSHELRTPLTSIRGSLGLVLGKFATSLDPAAQGLIETANRNAERLTQLINDMLDLEKISSGSLDFNFQPVDLVTLAERVIHQHEKSAQDRQVRLVLDTTDPGFVVRADESRLGQVLAHLLSNAIKFTSAGDTITLYLKRRQDHVRVTVEDHGRGIPASFRSRIFGPFVQLDSSDGRGQGGTGLGLSMSKAILQRHDTDIDYQSRPGMGSTFFFDLPLLHTTSSTQPEDKGAQILICEDDDDNACILQWLLEKEGITSHVTPTAAGARQALAEHHYKALILDLILPDGNGQDVLESVPADCKVVVFSSTTPDALPAPEKVSAVLTKTQVSDDALLGMIKQILHSHAA